VGKRILAAHCRGKERRVSRQWHALALTAALVAAGGLVAVGAFAQQTAPAWEDHRELENPALQARFERITKELRCLVCQNESIADSNADLANDLRRQVREMLIADKSDDAIFKYMTDRYGEFVRFAPPLTAKTALIWGAPFFMLLLGATIIYRVVRQRSRMPIDE
jgi:cytochrome c-type biogenesis protein CcmH